MGTCGESLSIILSAETPHYTSLELRLDIPNAIPPFHQEVSTSTYSLPDIGELDSLLDGNSAVIFEFPSLNGDFRICEHTWGARYALIVTGAITSIMHVDFSPWPNTRPIGDYVLDRNPTAACINFAFRVDHERVQEFRDQLSDALNAL